jgi:MoaE-MoaD fusion protein
MISVQVRFFAGHRDITGTTQKTVAVAEGTTLAALWERMVADYPPLGRYTNYVRFARNQQFCDPATPVEDGDVVAFIPPVSGGIDAAESAGAAPTDAPVVEPFALTSAPLDPRPMMEWARTPADGAIVTFAGVVRDNTSGRATSYLVYEAYTEMAITALAQLAEEARARWPVGRVAIHHRTGRLEIGETAVLVVVAAPHRGGAFAAAEYLMERIKQDVPVWKYEQWADSDGGEWRGQEDATSS